MAGMMQDEDDDLPRLSASTLAALHEFLHPPPPSILPDSHSQHHHHSNDVSLLPEDWRLSQFWYDHHTAFTLAQELHLLSMRLQSPVACISCPSLYVELKKSFPDCKAQLLEFDQRFQRYGDDFTFYDFNSPEDVPHEHQHAFQVVVADPPYLSEECLRKTVHTMKLLAKDETCFLLLTGAVQHDKAQCMLGSYPCGFRPSHQNKLGNEFMLFTNYDPHERLGGWEKL